MGISRSSFYALPADKPDDGKIVGEMQSIVDEFEAYGYRRKAAELRHPGLLVNDKKVRRSEANTPVHSSNGRLEVTMVEPRS